MKRLAAGVLGGVLLAGGAAGCASARSAAPAPAAAAARTPSPSPSGPASEAPVKASAKAPATGTATAPSAAVVDLATLSGGWPRAQSLLLTATDRLDTQCLRAAGFPVPELPPEQLSAPEDTAATVDLPGRRRYGYGIATPYPQSPPPAAQTYAQTLSGSRATAFAAAQFGAGRPETTVGLLGVATVSVPTQGCVARSRSRLAGSVTAWARLYYIPQQVETALDGQARTDPRYLAAQSAWSRCMAARGRSYPGPDAAVQALTARYRAGGGTAAFRREEVAVAVADGQCAASVRLPQTRLAVDRALVPRLPSAELAVLASLAADQAGAVARTAQLNPL